MVYQCQPALIRDLADNCQAPKCGGERPGASGGRERLTIRRLEYDTSILPRMIDVTDNLGNMNLKDILMEFNIEDIIDDTKEKGNIKTKKL